MAAAVQEFQNPPIFNIVFAMLALKLVVQQLKESMAKDASMFEFLRDKNLSGAKRGILASFMTDLIAECTRSAPIENKVLESIILSALNKLESLRDAKIGRTEKILDDISLLYAKLTGIFSLKGIKFVSSYSSNSQAKYLLKALYCLANELDCFRMRLEIEELMAKLCGTSSQIWTAADNSNAGRLFRRLPENLKFELPDSMDVMDIALSVLRPDEKAIAQQYKIGNPPQQQTLSMFSAGSSSGGGDGNGATASQPVVH